MVSAAVEIAVDDDSDLARIVKEVNRSRTPVVVRASNGQAARVVPIRGTSKPPRRPPTQEERDDFFAAFGSWAEVDTEQLKADIKAARGSS
ncbi:MAG: hypothetical protein ACR2OO_16190 [Thermomicrobiales bacterium]